MYTTAYNTINSRRYLDRLVVVVQRNALQQYVLLVFHAHKTKNSLLSNQRIFVHFVKNAFQII